MEGIQIPSIQISDIDMGKCYFNPATRSVFISLNLGRKYWIYLTNI
jgi:hypothetical protein